MKKLLSVLLAVNLLLSMSLQTYAMQVFVKPQTGTTITLEVEENDSINAIKAKIQEKTGIAPENQALYYGNVLLVEGKTLLDYGIGRESSIQLTVTSSTVITGSSYDIEICGYYTPATGGADKISVDIAWDNMEFTYDAGNKGTWNSETHTYDNVKAAGWKDEQKAITITNHSNTGVAASFTFAGTNGVTGTFTDNVLYLDSADADAYRTMGQDGTYPAPNETTRFSIDSTSPAIAEASELGVITVKIQKAFFYDATSVDADTLSRDLEAAHLSRATHYVLTLAANADEDTLFAVSDAISNCYNQISLTLKGVQTIPEKLFAPEHHTNRYARLPSTGGGEPRDFHALTSIFLPDATSIKANAFYQCSGLVNVNAPKVTAIDKEAFYHCYALTSIFLPKAETIGEYAFWLCDRLTSADLPEAQSIGDNAFEVCSTLKTVNIPKATTLGVSAFGRCTTLESISLPSVTEVGPKAFKCCSNLKNITFGTPVTTWGTSVFNGESYAPLDASQLTLTFAPGQKTFTGDNETGWTIAETNVTASDKEFCGYTFKEIKITQ